MPQYQAPASVQYQTPVQPQELAQKTVPPQADVPQTPQNSLSPFPGSPAGAERDVAASRGKNPLYKRPWFWCIIAAVVVIALVIVGINVKTRQDRDVSACSLVDSRVTYTTAVSCENWEKIKVSSTDGSTLTEIERLFGYREPDDADDSEGPVLDISRSVPCYINGHKSKEPSPLRVYFENVRENSKPSNIHPISKDFYIPNSSDIRLPDYRKVKAGQSKRDVFETLEKSYEIEVRYCTAENLSAEAALCVPPTRILRRD